MPKLWCILGIWSGHRRHVCVRACAGRFFDPITRLTFWMQFNNVVISSMEDRVENIFQNLSSCGKICISRTFVITCKQVAFACKIICVNKQKWSLATDLSCFSGPSIIKKIVHVRGWQLCGLRWRCLVALFASAENNELAIWWMWREQRWARMQCCDVLLSWDSNLESVFCCCWSHLIMIL